MQRKMNTISTYVNDRLHHHHGQSPTRYAFPWPDRPMSAALTLGGKKLRKQWSACCPAHDDKSPSLIIFEGRTGAVQVRCMAGCEPIEIIAEIRWHEVADRLSMTPPPPGERWFTVVHSISPGVRVRRHVLNFEDAAEGRS